VESKERSFEGNLWSPLPSAENKQRKSSHPALGSPRKSADANRNSVGITATRMTLTRLIFNWTRGVSERSTKNNHCNPLPSLEHNTMGENYSNRMTTAHYKTEERL
jgi:hypothetical protein